MIIARPGIMRIAPIEYLTKIQSSLATEQIEIANTHDRATYAHCGRTVRKSSDFVRMQSRNHRWSGWVLPYLPRRNMIQYLSTITLVTILSVRNIRHQVP